MKLEVAVSVLCFPSTSSSTLNRRKSRNRNTVTSIKKKRENAKHYQQKVVTTPLYPSISRTPHRLHCWAKRLQFEVVSKLHCCIQRQIDEGSKLGEKKINYFFASYFNFATIVIEIGNFSFKYIYENSLQSIGMQRWHHHYQSATQSMHIGVWPSIARLNEILVVRFIDLSCTRLHVHRVSVNAQQPAQRSLSFGIGISHL